MAEYDGSAFTVTPYSTTHATPNAKYIPELFSMKVMKLFKEAIILGEITNNDYEGEISGKGDKVTIRVAPTYLEVREYNPSNPYNDAVPGDIIYDNPEANARELLIDRSVYTAFTIDDVDDKQADIKLMGMFADTASYSLNRDTSKRVLKVMGDGAHDDNKGIAAGKISSGFNLGVSGTPVVVDATNAVEKIVDLGTVLDEYDVPTEGRFIVLPAWYCNFLKKGDLKRADITGDGTGAIRTGLIGEIDNFMVYKSNLIDYVTDGAATAFSVVAGVKNATTFAAQLTKTETVRAERSFGTHWRSMLVYGRKVIMPEALAVLYCSLVAAS